MKTATAQTAHSQRFYVIEIALMVGLALFLLTGGLALQTQDQLAEKVVRLHILANSDTEEDQALKLQVRDVVLERATEILKQSADRQDAEARLRGQLLELERLAAEEIRAEGYDYPVTVELTDTAFPTREYDGFTLPAGTYLALRVVIGAGEGHNWWCVVFPPPLHRRRLRCGPDRHGGGTDGGPGGIDHRGVGRICAQIQGSGALGGSAGPLCGLR